MSCTLCLLLRSNRTAAYTTMSQLAVIQEVPSVPAYAFQYSRPIFVCVCVAYTITPHCNDCNGHHKKCPYTEVLLIQNGDILFIVVNMHKCSHKSSNTKSVIRKRVSLVSMEMQTD